MSLSSAALLSVHLIVLPLQASVRRIRSGRFAVCGPSISYHTRIAKGSHPATSLALYQVVPPGDSPQARTELLGSYLLLSEGLTVDGRPLVLSTQLLPRVVLAGSAARDGAAFS